MPRSHTKSWKDALSVDFSIEAEKKEEIKQQLMRQIQCQESANSRTKKEDFIMNQTQKRRFKRSSVVALAASLTLVLSITAFAAANYLNLGDYAKYSTDTSSVTDEAVQIDLSQVEENEIDSALVSTLFEKLEDVKPYLAFTPKMLTNIPADYELEGYRIYNDESGQPVQDTKYLEMNFYKNDNSNDSIYVQARLMDEETAFEVSADDENIEKTTVNGYEAVLIGNTSVDILIDDVMYMISAKNLSQNEVIEIAESLTK